MTDIAVIIPMYNFGDMTRDCITATIENSGVPVDIHVIDDCSTVPFVDNRVTVHRLNKNVGYTEATNHGILKCWNDYKYVHFLNNDTIPRKDFIKILLDTLNGDKDIGIACSAREVTLQGKPMLEMYPIDLLTGWGGYQELDAPLDETYHCAWVPVCSALVRVEVIHYTGLLDRRMKNHCSDNDFCVRAGEIGYKTVLVPASRVLHIHEVTTKNVGANAAVDQQVLITKIRCDYRKNLLENFAVDGSNNKWGSLEFKLK